MRSFVTAACPFWMQNFLKIDVTASSKELRCDGRVPKTGCEVERRAPILRLKIDVTASCQELLRDGRCCRRKVRSPSSTMDPFAS